MLTGSERSIGRRYGDVVHWVLGYAAARRGRRHDRPADRGSGGCADRLFGTAYRACAREAETRWAAAGVAVCTNASPFRMHEQVPLLVPEVNADHIHLIEQQRSKLGLARLHRGQRELCDDDARHAAQAAP